MVTLKLGRGRYEQGNERPVNVRRFGIWVKRCLITGGVVWAATFAAVFFVALPSASTGTPAPADAIVCLGAGMSRSLGWQEPDNASRRRAMTCARLYQAGAAPVIVFTGYGHEESSVAAAMARVATEAGVPEQAVLLEKEARSTIQNASYALAMLPSDVSRVIVVSDAFHLSRSRLIFHFLSDVEVEMFPADPDLGPVAGRFDRSELRWIAREATAIWSNVARGAAYGLGGLAGIDSHTRIEWFN